MTISTVNPNVPAQNSPETSAPLRQNFAAAYNDINSIFALLGSGFTTTGAILSNSPSGGIGYTIGAGGTVTQVTSKATAVSLNKTTGTITLSNAALAGGAIVNFTLSNTSIAAADVLVLNHDSGGTIGAYGLNAATAANAAVIYVRNNTAGSLSEAIVIAFAVIKGATS